MVQAGTWRRGVWIAVAILVAGGVPVAQGQSGGGNRADGALVAKAEPGGGPLYQVHSDLVLVPVTVTANGGRAIGGLTEKNFRVFEDRVEQNIANFTPEQAAATVGLVLDCSDSMGPKLAKAQAAVRAVLQRALPGDEFFFIRFSHTPELAVSLTTDVARVRQALATTQVSGNTAVLDAVKMAWDQMRGAHSVRKAVVLISDGEDNSSRITPEDFRQLAMQSDTSIYSLFIGERPDPIQSPRWNKSRGPGLLDDIARQTGGRMFVVSNLKQLPLISAEIGSWIRSQYVVGYIPRKETPGYRRIEVRVVKPAGSPKLHLNRRRGYAVPGT